MIPPHLRIFEVGDHVEVDARHTPGKCYFRGVIVDRFLPGRTYDVRSQGVVSGWSAMFLRKVSLLERIAEAAAGGDEDGWMWSP
jgi:hypothetical protein